MWRLINCKGHERKRSWLNLMYYTIPEFAGKAWEKPRKPQHIPSPDRNLNPESPRYEASFSSYFLCFISSFRFIISFCSLHSWKYAHIHSSPPDCTNSTAKHKRTNTNIHALSGIRSRDLSIQAARTNASYCVATVMGTIRRVLVIVCFHRQAKLTHAVGGFLRFDKEP
jgi:hypothetical protein